MISLQAYRATIGMFMPKVLSTRKRKYTRTRSNPNDTSTSKCKDSQQQGTTDPIFSDSSNQGISLLKIILLCVIITMNMSFLKLLLLVKDGDIESNPGPLTYSITKSVTGSNNQGDLKYGETAGKQCMCNALYAIGWALIRRIGNWKKDDLDHILDSGDAVYKSLGTQNFLSFEEIPNSLELEGVSYRIDKLGFSSDYMFKSSSDSLKKNHDFQENEGNGFLLLFKGYTISITWSKAFFSYLILIAEIRKAALLPTELPFYYDLDPSLLLKNI